MPSAARIGVVLAVLGLCLFAIPLFFITTPSATYYIEAQATAETPNDGTAVPLEEVDQSIRNDVSEAIRSSEDVTVGTSSPPVPSHVRADGQVYQIVVYVADPGGSSAVVSLGLIGSGIVAFTASLLAFVVAGWRRYRRE